MDTVKNLN